MSRERERTSDDMNREGQKSYAGRWGDPPADQPESAADRVEAREDEDPERSVAIDVEADEGEFDENLVGNKRPPSD